LTVYILCFADGCNIQTPGVVYVGMLSSLHFMMYSNWFAL